MFKRNHRKTKYEPKFQQYKSVENQGKKRAKQNRKNKKLIKNAQHTQELNYTHPKDTSRTTTSIAELINPQVIEKLNQKLNTNNKEQ